MANHYYVKSGLGTRVTDTPFTAAEAATAFGSGNLTAANVFANLGALEGFPSSGDFIYISDQHASYFNNGAALVIGENNIYTGQGVTLISVSDTDCTVYKPGAHCALSDSFDPFRPAGNGAIYGVKFRTGNDTIVSIGTGVWSFFDCDFVTGGTNDKQIIANSDGYTVRCFNCNYTSDATADHLTGFVFSSGGRQEHYNGVYEVTAGSEPVRLLESTGAAGGSFFAEGCDFSACSGDLLLGLTAGTSDVVRVELNRCKLHASLTLPTPGTTLKTEQHTVELYGCTNSTDDAIHQFFYANGCGLAKNNDSVYTSNFGGWFKGSTKSSIKVETSALCSNARPFRFSLIEQYIDLTSSTSDLITLNLVTDAVLTDTDIAAYLTYSDGTNIEIPRVAGGAGTVTGAVWADPLAAGTTLATSALGAADWTGEPASPNFYKIEMDTSAVAGAKCVVKVAVEIYKDITTAGDVLYIDPTLVVS